MLIIKIIKIKLFWLLPIVIGVGAAKKLLLKFLLFLFPALSHLFKLCSYYQQSYHGTKYHHHHHLINHHHTVGTRKRSNFPLSLSISISVSVSLLFNFRLFLNFVRLLLSSALSGISLKSQKITQFLFCISMSFSVFIMPNTPTFFLILLIRKRPTHCSSKAIKQIHGICLMHGCWNLSNWIWPTKASRKLKHVLAST